MPICCALASELTEFEVAQLRAWAASGVANIAILRFFDWRGTQVSCRCVGVRWGAVWGAGEVVREPDMSIDAPSMMGRHGAW